MIRAAAAAAFALVVLALAGCASSRIELDFARGEPEKAGVLRGGEAARHVLEHVEIDPGFYGRGCFDVRIEANGDVWITLQADATSDWIIGRSLPQLAAAALGALVSPIDIIKDLLGIKPTPPNEVHGCGGIFETS